jgi:hypothetical protein
MRALLIGLFLPSAALPALAQTKTENAAKCVSDDQTRAAIYARLGRRDDAVGGYRAALSLEARHQAAMAGRKRLDAAP